MRRLIVFFTGMTLFLQHGQAQQSWLEDFDGTMPPARWTVTPSNMGVWIPNTTYYLPGGSVNPKSYLGLVPIELNTIGFAAGVYFYSIEYQGQKLVRRMSVGN